MLWIGRWERCVRGEQLDRLGQIEGARSIDRKNSIADCNATALQREALTFGHDHVRSMHLESQADLIERGAAQCGVTGDHFGPHRALLESDLDRLGLLPQQRSSDGQIVDIVLVYLVWLEELLSMYRENNIADIELAFERWASVRNDDIAGHFVHREAKLASGQVSADRDDNMLRHEWLIPIDGWRHILLGLLLLALLSPRKAAADREE